MRLASFTQIGSRHKTTVLNYDRETLSTAVSQPMQMFPSHETMALVSRPLCPIFKEFLYKYSNMMMMKALLVVRERLPLAATLLYLLHCYFTLHMQ